MMRTGDDKRMAFASRVICLGMFVFCVGVLPAPAQQTVTSATLSGRVEDEQGAAVRGATVNDTNVNDRPAGLGRNTGRGFDYASLDLRLSRRFTLGERLKLETIVEGFNVLDRANLQLPNNTFGTGATPPASFARATAADNPRQVQFGLRLDF